MKKTLMRVIAILLAFALLVMPLMGVKPMLAAGFVGLLLWSVVTVVRAKISGDARAGPGDERHNYNGEFGDSLPFAGVSKKSEHCSVNFALAPETAVLSRAGLHLNCEYEPSGLGAMATRLGEMFQGVCGHHRSRNRCGLYRERESSAG